MENRDVQNPGRNGRNHLPDRAGGGRRIADADFLTAMPFIIVILLILLVAQLGFWDTIGAIVGVTLSLIVALLLAAAIAYLAIRQWLARSR